MKKYKLLKDTPTIKAGTVFEEVVGDFDGLKALTRITPVGAKTSPQFTIKDIDNFDEWFEEIVENKRQRVGCGGTYWYIDEYCNVDCEYDNGSKGTDNFRYVIGNYFKTEEEAEAYKEYLIARQVLLDDAEGGKWKKYGSNYCAYYDYDEDDWGYDDTLEGMQTIGIIYFQNPDDIDESLKKHKEQWEIIRKYEMGEK